MFENFFSDDLKKIHLLLKSKKTRRNFVWKTREIGKMQKKKKKKTKENEISDNKRIEKVHICVKMTQFERKERKYGKPSEKGNKP